MKSEKILKTTAAQQKVNEEKDVTMSERVLSVRIETRSQNVRKDLEEVITSVGGMQIRDVSDPGGYDLFIVDINDEHGKDLHFVANILTAGVAGEVFLTSSKTNPEILIEALRIGAKEFFPQPLNVEEVKSALIKFKARAQKDRGKVIAAPVRRGKIIDVLGSKGGVGTTTVAVNLATSLASMEGVQSVALMDMNLLFGDIPLFLGIEPVFDWMEVAKNISRLDATYLMSTLYKHHSGIYVLPSPSKLMDEYKVTPQVIESLLKLMHTLFDYVVIDSGQSFDDVSKVIMKMSDKVLLVTLLSLPCLINVKRLQTTFRGMGYPHDASVEIIVNRFHKNSIVSMTEAEKNLDKKFLWTIPNDYQTTMSAINQGKPLVALKTESQITRNFLDFASALSGKAQAKRNGVSWFKYLKDKS